MQAKQLNVNQKVLMRTFFINESVSS